jgi:hypothetical protein
MILDLIVILLVIILSYLLCINNKTNDCQLSHIVIGLTVIVFYKLVRYYRIKQNHNLNYNLNNKEEFTTAASINDFISGKIEEPINQDINKLNNDKLTEYTNTLSELTNEIRKLNINSSSEQESELPNSNSNIDTLTIENQQSLQQFQIDYLTKQIKNAQDIINSETISKSTQNYKPIKIFSSCVANADGQLTMEQPINNEIKSLNPLNSTTNSESANKINETNSQGAVNISDLFSKLTN